MLAWGQAISEIEDENEMTSSLNSTAVGPGVRNAERLTQIPCTPNRSTKVADKVVLSRFCAENGQR